MNKPSKLHVAKAFALACGALCALALFAGCSSQTAEEESAAPAAAETSTAAADFEIDYGQSKLYDQADMDAAIDVIMAEFNTWNGCTMQRVFFTDDETCTEALSYCNDMREEGAPEFDEAIVFKCDYHSPSAEEAEGTAWEPDTDYEDWEWYLARTDGGEWQLLTFGY